MPNYVVTLEVRETRYMTLDLLDVEAVDEEQAVAMACKTYKDTGREEFDVQVEDIEEDDVVDVFVDGGESWRDMI